MAIEKNARPPGLRYNGKRPIWRATKAAIDAGYPLKSLYLSVDASPAQLHQRCDRLQAEMLAWLSGRKKAADPNFDGTLRSLLDMYQTDPQSYYRKLKETSRQPYDVYIGMMRAEIGERLIDRCDGRDVARWFEAWATPAAPGGKRTIAKARMAVSVLKAALTFGIMARLPGCPEFRAVLDAMKFEVLPSRTVAPTAEQVIALRRAARAAGHPGAALAYALQFETNARQFDIVGQWLALSDPAPSALLAKGKKWIGATWANVDANMILRIKPTKTEGTTGAETVFDLRACPMVEEELQDVPQIDRNGPLIADPKTGLPYTERRFWTVWRAAAKAAGLPPGVWNRDLRAGGTTEARQSGAPIDDVKKVMGHSAGSDTAATVYDRDKLEAHRRIMASRKAGRDKASS